MIKDFFGTETPVGMYVYLHKYFCSLSFEVIRELDLLIWAARCSIAFNAFDDDYWVRYSKDCGVAPTTSAHLRTKVLPFLEVYKTCSIESISVYLFYYF